MASTPNPTVEGEMETNSRASQWRESRTDLHASEIELGLIALLCLLFAWPTGRAGDEPLRQDSP
jgi:hypothetical protein